jgi:hypothetical protein
MDINPKELSQWLVELGTEWAEKKYASDLLEDAKKPLLASLGAQSNEKSQNAREAYALSHEDYKDFCQTLANAAKLTAIAKIKYEAANSYIEMLRTTAANERASNRVAT